MLCYENSNLAYKGIRRRKTTNDNDKKTSNTTHRSDEMELIMSDLERANERAASCERETENLRQQLSSGATSLQNAADSAATKSSDMEQAIDILKRSSLEVELAAKEKEIGQLVEDVQKLQASLNKLRENTSTQIAHLEEELSNKTRAFSKLEERMRSQVDYEEIKRELSIMKSIEFSSSSDQSDTSEAKAKTLEVLLLEKNKTLQTENTQLKVNTNDLNGPKSKDDSLNESFSSDKSESNSSLNVNNEDHASNDDSQSNFSAEQKDSIDTYRSNDNDPCEKDNSYVSPKLIGSPARSTSTTSSISIVTSHAPAPAAPVIPGLPVTSVSADMFASMLGHEVAASYLLPNPNNFIRLENGQIIPRLPVSLPGLAGLPLNGFHPHPEMLKRMQPNSPPMGPIGGGIISQATGSSHEATKINRPSTSESGNSVKVEPNNGQILDTAEVSLRIREILSAHNIGQRLFAKHVLGLSQGTVSELLSKPKHWDKLTEKGRESYRKMHSWASTEDNVIALKAISPKKGAQPIVSNAKQEDSETEERINRLLNNAQVAIQTRQNQEKAQIANAMVASIYHHELAKMSGGFPPNNNTKMPSDLIAKSKTFNENQMDSHRGRRSQADSDNLTREMITKIYQDQMLKLAIAAEKNGNYAEGSNYRQQLAKLLERTADRDKHPSDSIKSDVYNKSDNKDNLIHNNNTIKAEHMKPDSDSQPLAQPLAEMCDYSDAPQDLRVNVSGGSGCSGASLSSSSASSTSTNSEDPALRHAGSAFSLVRPRSTGPPGEHSPPIVKSNISPQQQTAMTTNPGKIDGLSPLQQMQSIANSLMTKNSLQGHSSRPLRAVLPPISQEQFDRYSNVNTDELVKQVKETLSQYSISQRLFGENILGLSQGSVSDLLARPKPWHMLTQKGREPFIRMQVFLEDQEAIPKLVANQYKIAPEKLLRTNSMGDSREQVPHANRCTSPPPFAPASTVNTASLPPLLPSAPITIAPQLLSPVASGNMNLVTPSASQRPAVAGSSTTPTSSKAAAAGSAVAAAAAAASQQQMSHALFPHLPPQFPLPHPLAFEHMQMAALQPNMFEMTAMSQELDTLSITTKVKEVLQFHNLGQKLFGEAILQLSQGSVSELLSKPKPWHMLSLKGREPFCKMHYWLNDPHNIDKLRFHQNEAKAAASKKRRFSCDQNDNSYNQKKPRVFFSDEQKEMLRLSYKKDPYPSQARIEDLANQLGVGAKTIVNWFHNHRMRAKQANGLGSPTMVPHMSSSAGLRVETGSEDSNHSSCNYVESGIGFHRSRHSSFGNGESGSSDAVAGSSLESQQQWLFPHFEPLALAAASYSKRNHDIDRNMDERKDEEDDVYDDDNDDMAAEDLTCKSKTVYSNGQDEDSQPESGCNSPTDLSMSSKYANNGCTEELQSISYDCRDRSVSRRKSSKPQWVYEGLQLDRSISLNGSNKTDSATASNAADVIAGSLPAPNSPLKPQSCSSVNSNYADENSSDSMTNVAHNTQTGSHSAKLITSLYNDCSQSPKVQDYSQKQDVDSQHDIDVGDNSEDSD